MSYALLVTYSLLLPLAQSQPPLLPTFTEPFSQAIDGMKVLADYRFGSHAENTVRDVSELSASFEPYGIAGTTVINQEWQRYMPFNERNFVFTSRSLDITALLPEGGGLFPGGIQSGQIWSKLTFKPGFSGYTVYGFEVRMRIPSAQGMWPAAWFYTSQPGQGDGSEIDNPEFFNMAGQNQFDWTGFQHGPGEGPERYSIKTNKQVWHPGVDFSGDYHNYQTLWTPDTVYKYVDGTLIYVQSFKWTAKGAAQLGVNLAVGTSRSTDLPGLQPTSAKDFPSVLSIQHMTIWAK